MASSIMDAEPISSSTTRQRSLTQFLRSDSQFPTDHKTNHEDKHKTNYEADESQPPSPSPEMAGSTNNNNNINKKKPTKNTLTVLDAEVQTKAPETRVAGPRPRARSAHENKEGEMAMIIAKTIWFIIIMALVFEWFMGLFQSPTRVERTLVQYHILKTALPREE